MNFRHLKIFLTVCETGSMTRAGKELYIAQPSISQAIAELEKYYEVRLFERLNHRLYLTAAGDRLRSYARHILNLSDQARKEMADLGQGGAIRIGASLTIGSYLLPELVVAFRQQSPEVEVFTQVDNTTLIEKLILEDQLDLGLVEGPITSPHMIEKPYREDDLVVIASPQHPLTQKKIVTVLDLNDQGFIVREAGSGTQAIFEHAMQAAQVSWKVVGVYNNIEAIKQAVIANLGLAVVPKISIAEEEEQKKLLTLDVQELGLKRKFNLIYHRQKFFTRAMHMFWDSCIATRDRQR